MRKYTVLVKVFIFAMLTVSLTLLELHAANAVSLATNVIKDPSDLPGPLNRAGGQTVTVNLTAQEVAAEIRPGENYLFWTFNGTVPGPMIRVVEGDTVVINLTNASDNIEPHNIDLQAAMGPGGGAAVTNVLPGETRSFSFRAMRSGTYMYYGAGEGMSWQSISHGMYGLIVVEPPGGLPRVNKEFYVGQNEWYISNNATSNINGTPVHDLDGDKATNEQPDLFTFNGNTQALVNSPLMVDQNSRTRIFFVNGGANKDANFNAVGIIFDKVLIGGARVPSLINMETVHVAPGASAVLEFSTPVPGKYFIIDHALWRLTKGAAGILNVNKTGAWPLNIYSPEP